MITLIFRCAWSHKIVGQPKHWINIQYNWFGSN